MNKSNHKKTTDNLKKLEQVKKKKNLEQPKTSYIEKKSNKSHTNKINVKEYVKLNNRKQDETN